MIVVIDNYDSFTFNLVQALGTWTPKIKIFKNDEVTLSEIEALNPSCLVISPGPGIPEKAGITLKVVEHFGGVIPILGVCLGHQAIAMVFGMKLKKAPRFFHGKTSSVFHDDQGLFRGVPNPFIAMRYHSWIIDETTLPRDLKITAFTEDKVPMAVQHLRYPMYGVQFHPESILTIEGCKILRNFLNS